MSFWNQLRKIPGAIVVIQNWYSIPLYYLGIKKELMLKLRNGLRFWFVPGSFGIETFYRQPYRQLEVQGRDVVDVGAFNADSSMYFSIRGANRVIAFEPFPRTYRLACRNLGLNTISNITMLNEAVSSEDGWVTINSEEPITSGNQLRHQPGGIRIPVSSLESLVRRFSLSNAALKLDCEGSEYDIIGSSSRSSLRAFREIILEYHKGFQTLERKFVMCGFRVRIIHRSDQNEGILLASRELDDADRLRAN